MTARVVDLAPGIAQSFAAALRDLPPDEVAVRLVPTPALVVAPRCLLAVPGQAFHRLIERPAGEALQELGGADDGQPQDIEVFQVPKKLWAPSTWFNTIGAICRAYGRSSEIGPQIQPLTFDLLRAPFEAHMRALDLDAAEVLRAGPTAPSWMSLERFRSIPGARAAHARLFLLCAEGIGPSFRGDGFVGRLDGCPGLPEIIGPVACRTLLATHRLEPSPKPPPVQRRLRASARRAPRRS